MPIKPGSSIRIYDSSLATRANFFKGTYNFQSLEFDPLVTGYAFIVWTKIPSWLETELGAGVFQAMTQKNFEAFSGLSDIDLATATQQYGFNGNEYHVVSGITKANTEFSIRHQEFSGSPIKNMYQLWVSGIRDPETGIATYPAKYGIEYAAKNHTGELMYIVTRPDANNVGMKNIEFAAYYTNVFPTRIPLGHLNYEMGSHDIQKIEIPFRGNLHISAQVDEYAKTLLDTTYAFRTEGLFDPQDDSTGGDTIVDYPAGDTEFPGKGSGDI